MAKYNIHTGNNIDTLTEYPDNYFDSVVTDPPYGIEFLAKDWDSNTGAIETWEQVFRVLKPGGYLLAFSAARTYHNLATNIELVGFEIRDQIMWLYSSGFPKAQDVGKNIDKRMGKQHKSTAYEQQEPLTPTRFMKSVSCKVCGTKSKNPKGTGFYCGHSQEVELEYPEAQQWAGWKTSLKPAHEPIVMARKPFKGSTVDNVLEHGVGALNIDATRVEYLDKKDMQAAGLNWKKTGYETGGPRFIGSGEENKPIDKPEQKGTGAGTKINTQGRFPSNVIGEVKDYQKYFYCAKVSRAERHIGFESAPSSEKMLEEMGGYFMDSEGNRVAYEHRHNVGMVYLPHIGSTIPARHMYEAYTQWSKSKSTGNNHPTVKPVALMKYLVKLVTPAGGKVLDPFTGSGSTGMAAVELGNEFTGCELDPDYVDIATKRIQAWYDHTDLSGNELPSEWFNEVN